MRHVSKKITALFCATSAAAFFAACDDSDEEPDARIPNMFDSGGPVIDGGDEIDAGIDGGTPAAYPGTISVQEIRILNSPLNLAGQGVQISISFEDGTQAVAPVLEEQPGFPTGCKAWEFTKEQAAVLSTNEGNVQVTVTPGAGETAPVYPPCVHNAAAGYVCASGGGLATGAVITPVGGGAVTFTLAGANFDNPFTPSSYLRITGATGGNNGAFPIVAVNSATTVTIVNPGAAVETIVGATATYAVLSGIGPNPAKTAEPFWLDNAAKVKVDITGAEGTHLGDLTGEVVNVGDSFALTAESNATLVDIPLDGEAFTIAMDCGGGTCPAATGSILNIVTTDGPTAGVPLPSLPPVKDGGKRVQVRCSVLGGPSTSVTVPAAYSKFLMDSGATRIQASFLRSGLTMIGTAPSVVNVVAGHGVVGFTDVAPAKPTK